MAESESSAGGFVFDDEKPNQPQQFDFPKREFGKAKPVKRAFQAQWFKKWRWLHYDCSKDTVFCHTCILAFRRGILKQSQGNVKDSAFIFSGFSNWKDGTVAFAAHEKSVTHKKAVDAIITIPSTTQNVGEMLSSAHAEEQSRSRQCLLIIAENIRFLARQGIALRGDGNEADSNFTQLLHLRAIHQPQLLPWLKRKSDKYTSPQIQNELLKVMATTIVRNISNSIQINRYFSIMADEVTDSSNKEQVVVCFRCINKDFEPHEEFVGLYQVDSIKSNTIFEILKDTNGTIEFSIE